MSNLLLSCDGGNAVPVGGNFDCADYDFRLFAELVTRVASPGLGLSSMLNRRMPRVQDDKYVARDVTRVAGEAGPKLLYLSCFVAWVTCVVLSGTCFVLRLCLAHPYVELRNIQRRFT